MEARSLAEVFAEPEPEVVRAPIRNREPREPMGGHKWHLIHERDGGHCWNCGAMVSKGTGEVDHLIPRSSFEPEDLWIADRSDNLRTSCVGCNQGKSNYLIPGAPVGSTPGVTACCWDCWTGPRSEWDEGDTPRPEMRVPAYCAKCGHTWVPDESWLL